MNNIVIFDEFCPFLENLHLYFSIRLKINTTELKTHFSKKKDMYFQVFNRYNTITLMQDN
jgi:hypothetical protein